MQITLHGNGQPLENGTESCTDKNRYIDGDVNTTSLKLCTAHYPTYLQISPHGCKRPQQQHVPVGGGMKGWSPSESVWSFDGNAQFKEEQNSGRAAAARGQVNGLVVIGTVWREEYGRKQAIRL